MLFESKYRRQALSSFNEENKQLQQQLLQNLSDNHKKMNVLSKLKQFMLLMKNHKSEVKL
ncbi:hypothetical protein [Chengkuizengella sediminis]|uniref:hypothetical protein n=1 Tax=Chengkuizengella sediminis TaxID=1885917 RepID=UPI001389EF15|nr:hypothetical protein [Chengkuizengella sediminis]NDI36438.1 hypothetical protein [Chengkuizengella sediminis]